MAQMSGHHLLSTSRNYIRRSLYPPTIASSRYSLFSSAAYSSCHSFVTSRSESFGSKYNTQRLNSTVSNYLQRASGYSTTTTTTTTTTPQEQSRRATNTNDDMEAEPTGLIAKSGIELLTFGTPNGYKISIMLEELKEAYGKDYTWQSVNIMKNTQKEPWFTAINPNGRIPAIVDHDRGGFAVFEGLPILNYLARHYDPEHRVSFPVDSDDYSVCEQWMGWQHGGLGPMQGQANHFGRFAKEKIPYAVQRYVGESERLYGILDKRLSDGREYVAGPGKGKFSIADMSILGWANGAVFGGLDMTMFPNVQAWLDRCLARPAVQKGMSVPSPARFGNAAVLEAIAKDPELKKQADENAAFIKEAKEKYGYKYASP